jgi:hypothetical protein
MLIQYTVFHVRTTGAPDVGLISMMNVDPQNLRLLKTASGHVEKIQKD